MFVVERGCKAPGATNKTRCFFLHPDEMEDYYSKAKLKVLLHRFFVVRRRLLAYNGDSGAPRGGRARREKDARSQEVRKTDRRRRAYRRTRRLRGVSLFCEWRLTILGCCLPVVRVWCQENVSCCWCFGGLLDTLILRPCVAQQRSLGASSGSNHVPPRVVSLRAGA